MTTGIDIILKYFPQLTTMQQRQFAQLGELYRDWNEKINVISRKDIDNLYEHHVLHSLALALFMPFNPGSQVLDIGTGGGFPGIPLAIMFPETRFTLIDSIGKKIRVASEVSQAIGLDNVTLCHLNAKEERGRYDFVVSRAVMSTPELVRLIRKNISPHGTHILPNGLICLKGGDLGDELQPLRDYELWDISRWLDEPFFETKKILYIPLLPKG